MKIIRLIIEYLFWHYTKAFSDMVRMFGNFIWFLYHYFSIPLLSKTLFSPWKRLHEEKKKGFDIEDLFGRFVVNVLMRFVGFFARTFVIIFGLISISLFSLLSLITILMWILLPFIILSIFGLGIKYLF